MQKSDFSQFYDVFTRNSTEKTIIPREKVEESEGIFFHHHQRKIVSKIFHSLEVEYRKRNLNFQEICFFPLVKKTVAPTSSHSYYRILKKMIKMGWLLEGKYYDGQYKGKYPTYAPVWEVIFNQCSPDCFGWRKERFYGG